MANIRINSLPSEASPATSDVVPIDGLTTRKATITAVVDAARPFASQVEAEAGVISTKAMNPLSTKQAITAIGGSLYATAAQGALAATATQPGDLATVATTGAYADLSGLPTLGTAAATDAAAYAPVAQAVPVGGTTGQVLAKSSATDNDVLWATVSGIAKVTFSTVAEAQAYSPDVAPDALRTLFFDTTQVPGSGATYKKVATEPAHSNKLSITLADGVTVVWYEGAPGDRMYGPQIGITPATTSGAAIQAAMEAAVACGATEWVFAKGSYSLDGPIIEPIGLDVIDFNWSYLEFASGVGARFVDYDAGLIALPAMTADLNPGDDTITFASAHGLAKDDAFLIWNDLDYSLNGWRPVYKDGQALVALEIISATQVKIRGRFDPRGYQKKYPFATCKFFKYGKQGVTHKRGIINGTLIASGAFRVRGVARPRTEDMLVRGGTTSAMQYDKCAFFHDENCDFRHDNVAGGTNYGQSLSNSGPGTSVNCSYYGTRHAATAGGDSAEGSIPCRDVAYFNPIFDSKSSISFDLGHGNCLDFTVIGGEATNGCLIGGGGHDVHLKNVYASPVYDENNFIFFSEMHGANHKIRVDRAYVRGTGFKADASSEQSGMVSIGGVSGGLWGIAGTGSPTVFATQEGGEIDISIGHIIAPNWTNSGAQVVIVRNRGFTGFWSLRHRIDHLRLSDGTPPIIRLATVSGSEPSKLTIETITVRESLAGADGWSVLPWTLVTRPGEFIAPALFGSLVHDPASLVDGAQEKVTVPVVGAQLGDFTEASFSNSLALMHLPSYVESAGNVAVMFQNESSVTRDLLSGTVRVRVTPRP